MIINVPCPVCSSKPINYIPTSIDIPFFGDCLQTTIICKKCNYRHSDILIASQKEPTRYEILVESPDDLAVRIVRSTSGTISVPELGVTIEPGPLSDAFVSNVEGVLERIKSVLFQAIDFAEHASEKEKGKELLEKINSIKKGDVSVRIIIDDPLGNSAIISDKAKKRVLTDEEFKKLKLGMMVLELSDR